MHMAAPNACTWLPLLFLGGLITQRPEPFLEQREGFFFPAIASTCDSLSKKATIPRPTWGVEARIPGSYSTCEFSPAKVLSLWKGNNHLSHLFRRRIKAIGSFPQEKCTNQRHSSVYQTSSLPQYLTPGSKVSVTLSQDLNTSQHPSDHRTIHMAKVNGSPCAHH